MFTGFLKKNKMKQKQENYGVHFVSSKLVLKWAPLWSLLGILDFQSSYSSESSKIAFCACSKCIY